jgi:hypothetical protein
LLSGGVPLELGVPAEPLPEEHLGLADGLGR